MEFKQKLLMIDGHALAHRAFHALPEFTNSEGFPTGAIFGFFSMFLKALQDIKPTHALVAFDLPGPTFRHKLAADYKATRKAPADELSIQFPPIKEILSSLNIPVFEKKGYEADDLLGIISRLSGTNVLNIVVTGDLDLLQLINRNTQVFRFRTGFSDYTIYDLDEMQKQFGITPKQWVDYKALKGDPSDNIPGVRGIGPKTALELIKEFKTLESLYEAVEDGSAKIKTGALNRLKEGKASAFLSKRLSFINCRDGLDFEIDECRLSSYDKEKVVGLFKKYAIRSLIERLPKTEEAAVESIEKKSKEGKYEIIETEAQLRELVTMLGGKKEISIDAEKTLGLLAESSLVGISLSCREGEAFYLPVMLSKDIRYLSLIRPVLEDGNIKKIGHDLKTDSLLLQKYDIMLSPLNFDTKIAAYLINPGQRNYDLESLSFSHFGIQKTLPGEFAEKPKDKLQFELLKKDEQARYSCEDADLTIRLKKNLHDRLKELGLLGIFKDIEMPLIFVLRKMEERGVLLDVKFLQGLSHEAEIELDKTEKLIFKLAGTKFNISSPIQLREVLFDRLGIPTTELKKRGKTGELSTAATELEKLRGLHPVVDLIFNFRELAKLKSTYLDALPKLVSKTDKRVHTSYHQTIAATGRLSSTDPNLQNIPVRTQLGRRIRRAFIAEKGFLLASLDYSQIELRIAASLSNDPEMIKIFKSGKDFHAATAARLFNVMESAVTYEQRRDAKTINFSVLYGVSAFGLSERSEMGREEAGQFIKRYFEVFSKLKKFIDEQINKVRDEGYAVNLLGRIRFFPEINSSNFSVRNAAERAAFNMPIQSLAADIIKIAMLRIDEKYLNEDCRMLLQVHDELVFEIAEDKAKNLSTLIKKEMEEAFELKVPLVVDAKMGKNWLEMEKV
jgi:DNA polymerase I